MCRIFDDCVHVILFSPYVEAIFQRKDFFVVLITNDRCTLLAFYLMLAYEHKLYCWASKASETKFGFNTNFDSLGHLAAQRAPEPHSPLEGKRSRTMTERQKKRRK